MVVLLHSKFFLYHGTHVGFTIDHDPVCPHCVVWERGYFMLQPMVWLIPVEDMEIVDPLLVYKWLGEIYQMSKKNQEAI